MNISDFLIHKNHQYCVFYKPAGMPLQDDKSGDKSLISAASAYLKHDVFPVHRIDRPVAGLILLANHKKMARTLSDFFAEGKIKKLYLAFVEGEILEQEGTWQHYLKFESDRTNKSVISDTYQVGFKEIETDFKVLGKTDHYTLLLLKPITGKHHQLRAQLAHLKFPIKGDVKYGARRKNKDRSIDLLAYQLSFNHPISDELKSYQAPIPDDSLWQAGIAFIETIEKI